MPFEIAARGGLSLCAIDFLRGQEINGLLDGTELAFTKLLPLFVVFGFLSTALVHLRGTDDWVPGGVVLQHLTPCEQCKTPENTQKHLITSQLNLLDVQTPPGPPPCFSWLRLTQIALHLLLGGLCIRELRFGAAQGLLFCGLPLLQLCLLCLRLADESAQLLH